MYDEVKELQELATASRNPFSSVQQINIGIQLIKTFNDFDTRLTTWFDLLPVEKNWLRFKTYTLSMGASVCRVR